MPSSRARSQPHMCATSCYAVPLVLKSNLLLLCWTHFNSTTTTTSGNHPSVSHQESCPVCPQASVGQPTHRHELQAMCIHLLKTMWLAPNWEVYHVTGPYWSIKVLPVAFCQNRHLKDILLSDVSSSDCSAWVSLGQSQREQGQVQQRTQKMREWKEDGKEKGS